MTELAQADDGEGVEHQRDEARAEAQRATAWHMEALDDLARAERDAYLAALSAIASMPSASIAVRDVARHALLNGGAS